MDTTRLQHFVDTFWDDSILPSITEYIRIPNKSPAFDPQWVEHGYMEEAVTLMEAWARQQLAAFPGATLEVVRLPGRTPLLLMDLPGDSDDTVLLYGHLDKQPEMKGWSEGLGPWQPVRKDDKLYGRGGADDGYAIYACLCALLALKEQKLPRARCVVMIEACEESGSYDLPYYVDHLKEPHRQALARGLPRFGLRRLRPAVAHHLAARHRGRHAHGARADRGRAFGRRVGDRALLLPADCARSCRGSRTRPPARSSCRTSTCRSRRSASSRPSRRPQVLGDSVYTKFPFAGATRPMADERADWC